MQIPVLLLVLNISNSISPPGTSRQYRADSTRVLLHEAGIAMAESKIEWTDVTWNPLRGCVKVSPGCKHCYAEKFAERWRGIPNHAYEQGFDLRVVPHKLLEPLSWSKPRTVFVNSMSDLFQEGVPDDYISAVASVMEATPWHTYQVLTKRAERMARILSTSLQKAASAQNILWGVSVEDREHGVPRIAPLRSTNARTTFLSIEPLLEDLGQLDLDGISWVIVGGESGPGARTMELDWVLSIRDQCRGSQIPFFFKQWGGTQKKRTGRSLLGKEYDEMPSRSRIDVPDRSARAILHEELLRRFQHRFPDWQSIERRSPAKPSTRTGVQT